MPIIPPLAVMRAEVRIDGLLEQLNMAINRDDVELIVAVQESIRELVMELAGNAADSPPSQE